jgi:protein tyrosine phosphatase (PTP) superfamily phosphohydrolase (DUF442 family)
MMTVIQRGMCGIAPVLAALAFATLAADKPASDGELRPRTVGASAYIPERLQIEGIENAFRLSPRLYSGGDPQGEKAFARLQALGVKTIISVDGARPDIETARRLGIRYIHLPVGYDGISREQAVRLVEATRRFSGPVFIHCHHGKHRGPTAAALCGVATENWSKDHALSWLKQAGTAPDYRGLFATVRNFEAPSPAELACVASDLPEQAKVPAVAEGMVQVDRRWDHLKAIREAGFRSPPSAPDLDPPHEALQLAEHFREMLRQSDVKARGAKCIELMESAERQATDLQDALRAYHEAPSAIARKAVESAFYTMGKSCTCCHSQYRDNTRPAPPPE